MSKTIKKYNETTGEWEALITPDVSLVQTFENGETIYDTNITVTNENYASTDSQNPNTLDDTLSAISDDISKLQRNVSWLAKHGTGGGGGGGGGGVVQSYGIEVTYKRGNETIPLEKGQSVYSDNGKIVATFMITGGTKNDICRYSYKYGGTVVSGETEVDKEVTFTVNFDKSATVIISAQNPYGSTISPFNFSVYMSSLTIRYDAESAGGNYDPGTGIYRMSMTASRGTIHTRVKNGLGNGSTVTYKLRWADNETAFTEECRTDVEYTSSAVNLWDLPGVTKTPGFEYAVTVSATARMGNIETPESSYQVRIRIINPSDLTLAMSVNGMSDMENPIDIELDTPMNISFKAYGPNSVSKVYYAGKLTRSNGDVVKIFGKYYDDDLKDEGAEVYNNESANKNTTVTLPFALSSGLYPENEVVTITLKAWGINTNFVTEASQAVRTIPISGFFPRQYGKRNSESPTKDIMFASWNSSNANGTDKFEWTSNVLNYSPVMYDDDNMNVVITGKVINGNTFSGLEPNPPKMRLQNNAYMKITIPEQYRNELYAFSADTNETLIDYNGYTISVTLKADETPLPDRVSMLWGTNMADGVSVASGIKITSSKVYWAVSDSTTLVCDISSGEKHTIDFEYNQKTGLAKIYVNGVLNQAAVVKGSLWPYETDIYIGTNYHNGATGNTCDMSLYELSIYTNLLTDTQLIINGKNARLETRDVTEYNEWKVKNFLYTNELTNEPYSMFEQEKFTYSYITGNIAPNSNIPTMAISFPNESTVGLSGFTEDYFYSPADKIQLSRFTAETSYYYDNETKVSFEGLKWAVELQGTSTLKYRVKNLEIYMTETTQIDGEAWPVLFQPKEDWFPEKQFTLKADVVDSAHANNTVIGQWVNNPETCPILEKTPPMIQLESHRPADTDKNGAQMKNEFNEDSFNQDVTIKHTTEGFPILLFLSFAGQSDYVFAGIYSFNLGRYSYYNLGLKFLESFSRYSDTVKDTQCPRTIEHYKETRTFGNINADNVYSYEFDNLGSDTDSEHPVWSQYGLRGNNYSLMDSYGSFKYGEPTTQIKASLSSLMETVATSKINYTTIYDNIRNHMLNSEGVVVSTGEEINQTTVGYGQLREKLSLNNAAAYFVIANAFGMTDSLGKNMTLRTWDGAKWYTCFYDMDTALGLDNRGAETIPTNAAIDYIYYNFEEGVNQGIKTIYHSDTVYRNDEGEEVPQDAPNAKKVYSPTYAAYKSKLWALLRETAFLYDCGESTDVFSDKVESGPYIKLWSRLRNGPLSRAEKFSDMVSDRVAKCGEIIYDRDYDSKYIKDNESTSFLHGTRVEYIKKWVRSHMYFLDGVFDINTLTSMDTSAIEDSPYYKDLFNFRAYNKKASNKFYLTISSTIPIFFSIGVDTRTKYYIEESGKDYRFPITVALNTSTQMQMYGTSVFTKIDGLSEVFEGITDNSSEDCLKSLMTFIARTATLGENPFNRFKAYLDVDSGGQLEMLDISNSTFFNNNETLDLGGLTKVLRINVSNTNLSSLILPDSSLDYLNVTYSNIGTLKLDGQNKLTSVSIDGCSNMTTFSVERCEKVEQLSVSSKDNLQTVTFGENASLTNVNIAYCPSLTAATIYTNQNLEEIYIDNCPNLRRITVYGNNKLKKVTISNCTAQDLIISIKDAPLETLHFNDVMCAYPITLPSRTLVSGMTSLYMSNCFSFKGFQYDGESVEVYEGKNVFDLSPMVSLNGRTVNIINVSLEYVRVANDPEHPLVVYSSTFNRCTSLIKIFGHIQLQENVFGNCRNYYINHEQSFVPTRYHEGLTIDDFVYGNITELLSDAVYLYDGIYPPFITTEQDPYYTNITIGPSVTNLNNWFANTSCDIHDAYYVLQLCNERIKSLQSTFSGCRENLTLSDQEWLDINMFAKCVNVENINYLFNGCEIDCLVLPNVFEPVMTTLEEFVDVFSGDYTVPTLETCFFPEGNKLKKLSGFKPKPFGDSMFFTDVALLSTLTKLEEINNSFNNCSIDFTRATYDATELFKNNVSLKRIIGSFRNIGGSGSLRNIFGGDCPDDLDHYPRELDTVANSFTFAEGISGHKESLYEGDDCEGVLMPLGNSLFKSVKKLRYLTGSEPGGNRTNSDYSALYYESDSFCGPGLLKYIDNIPYEPDDEGYYRDADCNPDGFPHEIFYGLTRLEEVPALFYGAKNFKNLTYGEDGPEVPEIRIPLLKYNGESMFKDCSNLKNISKLFKGLDPSIVCTLDGKAFKNCKLVNVESAFERVHISGGIPFGLFYQSIEQTWDDGTTYELENPTIEHMVATFNEIRGYSGLTSYAANAADLVMDNPEFTRTATAGSKNSYKKIWNLYSYDGTSSSFISKMNEARTLYGANLYDGENPFAPYIQHAQEKWDAVVDPSNEDFSTYVGFQFSPNTVQARTFAASNYFCPPDIFKYCANNENTTVSNALANVSGEYSNGTFYGLYGRIPEMLLYPLTEIKGMSGLLSGNRLMFPHYWKHVLNGTPVNGMLYPESMFEGLSVNNIDSMFSGTRVWPYASVPTGLFTPIAGTLTYAQNLWNNAFWAERFVESTTNTSQVPSGVFSSCHVLIDISGMFGDSMQNSIAFITSNLFTPENNPLIRRCASFLKFASVTHGALPRFWEFSTLPPNGDGNVLGAFNGVYTGIGGYDEVLNLYESIDYNPYLRLQ